MDRPFACIAHFAGVPFRLEGGQDGPDWWLSGVSVDPLPASEQTPVPAPVRRLARALARGDEDARRAAVARCRWPADTTVFRRLVLTQLATRVPAGSTVTYGGLATLCERHGAARAVGSVMATNPFPVLIPCHRVVGSKGIGWFMGSAAGMAIKHRWLVAEHAALSALPSAAGPITDSTPGLPPGTSPAA
jgi:methylated-DNA-[protein]-cysteine S-methyltransferase